MKRIIKSMLSALLITALLISLLTISAGAALPPALVGDVNCDDSVDILDVTLIERYLIDNVVFVDHQKVVADFDRDGDISVIDATWIQRKEVGMTIPQGYGGLLNQDILVTSFYADYASGKAAAGVPVTFTARANCGAEDCTYAFYIDGKMIQERSEDNTFTYSFPESGDYNVEVKAFNKDGFSELCPYRYFADINDSPYQHGNYHVVDSYPYDQLGLVSVNWIDYEFSPEPTLEVRATGGTAPYTYSYTILDLDSGENYSKEYYEKLGWQMLYDKDENPYLYRDFSENSSLTIPVFELGFNYTRRLVVQAKDADGNLTEAKTVIIEDQLLMG
nr:dockerin type I domain-containing protein [uncultured Ruminococcus sp.]